MPKLIALCGQIGSGKTTAAKHLVARHGFTRQRFAGPLKAMMAIGLGLTMEEVDGKLKEVPCDKLGGKTPRFAMQTLGTEWGRDLISPDLWIRAARRDIEAAMAAGLSVVVDDCRFPNEVEVIHSMGGKVLCLLRGEPGVPGHPSEDLRNLAWDWIYDNTGTIEGLEYCLDEMIMGRLL